MSGLVLAAGLVLAGAASGQTQAQLNQQSGDHFRAADRALNAAYARLLAQASPQGRIRLRTAERAWLTFRQADCAARTGSRDGSVYPTMLAQCLATATEARTRQLNGELTCLEGDMGCGGHRQD